MESSLKLGLKIATVTGSALLLEH
jgi:hypothetical protein